MAQGLSTPNPSLSPTHLSIRRGRATTTHYTHHQVILMVSRNTTLVPSLGLRIGPACEAGLNAGMRREHVPPQIRKKERKKERKTCNAATYRFRDIRFLDGQHFGFRESFGSTAPKKRKTYHRAKFQADPWHRRRDILSLDKKYSKRYYHTNRIGPTSVAYVG